MGIDIQRLVCATACQVRAGVHFTWMQARSNSKCGLLNLRWALEVWVSMFFATLGRLGFAPLA